MARFPRNHYEDEREDPSYPLEKDEHGKTIVPTQAYIQAQLDALNAVMVARYGVEWQEDSFNLVRR